MSHFKVESEAIIHQRPGVLSYNKRAEMNAPHVQIGPSSTIHRREMNSMAHRRYYKPKHIKKFAKTMSRNLSAHELMFLRRLTLGNVGSFDFQVRIGFYIADFVFPSKMLIIELDGPNHTKQHDEKRDEWLAQAGFTTWRIKNSEAALWPLSRIADYQRPADGRGFIDAIKWANGQHDKATAIRGRKPSPALSLEVREANKEDFYKRLIAKTNQVQKSERERRERYAEQRTVKIVKRGG